MRQSIIPRTRFHRTIDRPINFTGQLVGHVTGRVTGQMAGLNCSSSRRSFIIQVSDPSELLQPRSTVDHPAARSPSRPPYFLSA